MKWLQKLECRYRALFNKRKLDAEMDEEMRSHLEMKTQANLDAGMGQEEARYSAMQQFGWTESIRETCREQRGTAGIEGVFRDLHFAIRQLSKNLGFTVIAVVSLALGIGLNTSMFSLLNVILLRPLPFEQPTSLVRLHRLTPQGENDGFSPADYIDLKHVESPFGQFAGYTQATVSLSQSGRPAELHEGIRVSSDYFSVLRIHPELGRAFTLEEEIFGNHRVVILSHASWQNRFNGAPDIIGQIIRVEGESHEIVGVLPDWANDDRIIRQISVFRPLSFSDHERVSRDNHWVNIIGRRANSLTTAQGEAFITAFGAHLASDFPKENAGIRWDCKSLQNSTGHASGRVIIAMLLGLSGFVLLIACSNLANFLLARTISRSHEFSVRASLGASRFQLIRPLALESLLLAAAGGVAALFVSMWAADWLRAQSVASGGAPMQFPLDWRVLSFAMISSLLTALFFGIVPALFAMRVDVNNALKSGTRGATVGRGHQRLRHALVIGQFAMAMILLASAGFLVRGAENQLRQNLGWNSDHVAQGYFELPTVKYAGIKQILAFHRHALEQLEQLPGVKAASLSYTLGLFGPRQYVVEGRESPAKGFESSANFNGITPAYFEVTGTRLLNGRMFNASDSPTSTKVTIINECMARTLFPNDNPIGHRIAQVDSEKENWMEIVGVVNDVSSSGLYQPPVPFQVYHPLFQEPWQGATIAIRTTGAAPESMLDSIRSTLAPLDPDLPLRSLMTADIMIARSSSDLDMLKKLLGAFALLGLLLATLGIYGVIARTVAQRTGEIGIRMALGAQVTDVIKLVLGSGVRLALIGAGIGLLGAFGLSRLIMSIMPAIQTNGGKVIAVATAVLVAIAFAACYLPARRAAKVDPIVALRHE